jgi:hypothetical protein
MKGEKLGDIQTKDYLTTVYDPVPCIWTIDTPHATYGATAVTTLDSVPQQADIVVDGIVIGKTPASIILEVTNTQKDFIVTLRKAGYQDASGIMRSGRRAKIKLILDNSQIQAEDDMSKGDDLPPIKQKACDSNDWINAYALGKKNNPQPSICPGDRSRPLFTREGTIACQSIDTLRRLINTAWTYSWFTIPSREDAALWLAGIQPEGQVKHVISSGCRVYHDGTSVKIHEEDRGMANTNIGWVDENNLRNR